MIKQPDSIFNDVIGPIMRGPSSSHTAAAVRIGRLVGQTVKGNIKEFIADFDPKGSLAATYHSQGSDIGLIGGLLNMEPTDANLMNSIKIASKEGMNIKFNIIDYPAEHPNTYKITVVNDQNETIHLTAISTGGGMIKVEEIEGFKISIAGDFFETLLFYKRVDDKTLKHYVNEIENIVTNLEFCNCSINDSNGNGLINIKTANKLSEDIIVRLKSNSKLTNIIELTPVLPIMSRKDCAVPFNTADEMLKAGEKEGLQLWELAVMYESSRGNISKEQVFEKMKNIVKLMKSSIQQGLSGTTYEDRILGYQSLKIKDKEVQGKIIPGSILNTVISYITAIMEVKSSMGVIVAAPTAGSCAGLPGTIIGTATELALNDDEITKAMLAAGMIGVFIAEHATFAAEVGGCQAECGSGSGMTAAGLVQLMGGTASQAVDAASMALQNIFGIVCDPVAERVEVPCLGKNVMAGFNAIASANMALANFDKVIPLDETIAAMDKVGRMLPSELRCTGNGGLSRTKTAQDISRQLG